MSKNLNQWFGTGNLTRDPELSYTQGNNTALCKFSIASNKPAGQGREDHVSYFDIVVWGKLAELCNQYLAKGKQVAIIGELKQERFVDKQQNNRTKIVILADQIQFLGGPQNAQSQSNGGLSSNHGNSSNQGNNGFNQPNNGFGNQPPQQKYNSDTIDDIGGGDDTPF